MFTKPQKTYQVKIYDFNKYDANSKYCHYEEQNKGQGLNGKWIECVFAWDKISLYLTKIFPAALPTFFGILTLLLLSSEQVQADGSPFVLQCNESERISRIVVRTGRRVDFLGIDCKSSTGRSILKTGGNGGSRHEIFVPTDLRRVHITRGRCGASSTRVCSIQFEMANGKKSPEFGRPSSARSTLDGNGEIYGFFGRSGAEIDDLKVLTRKVSFKNDPLYDTRGIVNSIRQAMRGSMGYAAVVRNPDGQRIGFVRAGWAIHPQDSGLGQHAGQFDVHTKAAVGSTTKAWASAVAALKVDEFTQAQTLDTPFQQYLPRRWRAELSSRFQGATSPTVLDVIKHRAGFRRNGPPSGQTQGTLPARFRLRTGEVWPNADSTGCPADKPKCNRLPNRLPSGNAQRYERLYSNTAGGLFHFILPHMMLASVSGAPAMENSPEGLSDSAYDTAITAFTGKFYENFVQEHILAPVGAVANCNSRLFLGNQQVAAAYERPGDRDGVLPGSSTNHCAAGGWVISANDLTKVLSALVGTNKILNAESKGRLLNFGADRVWDVTSGGHHTHDGLHDGMRAAVIVRNDGYVAALIYNSMPDTPIKGQQLLVEAFRNNIR